MSLGFHTTNLFFMLNIPKARSTKDFKKNFRTSEDFLHQRGPSSYQNESTQSNEH